MKVNVNHHHLNYTAMLVLVVLNLDSARAATCDPGELLCGQSVGQCMYQSIPMAPVNTYPNAQPGSSICCYDPQHYQCGAGVVHDGDDFVTPLLGAKKDYRTSRTGTDLDLCGFLTIYARATCDLSACNIPGNSHTYEMLCPLTNACTNDASICPESVDRPCPSGEDLCGDVCYVKSTHFCSGGRIYSKSTHDTCGSAVFEKSATKQCCGGSVIDKTDRGCCWGRSYKKDTHTCCGRSVVAAFDETEYHCTGGTVCRVEEEAHRGQCYVPGSALIGENCVVDDHCRRGDCSRTSNVCICTDDQDCPSSQYCNNRVFEPNRCLQDGTLVVGDSCFTNRQCASNKCQGGGCVCASDSDCDDGEFCNNRLSANRCLPDRSLSLGESCSKNAECRSGKCQGNRCVCRYDSHCHRGQYCNTRVGAPNQCVRTKSLGSACSRGSQCASSCCKFFKFKVQCRPSSKCN